MHYMNRRKTKKISQIDKPDNHKKWANFESCATIKWIPQTKSSVFLLGYTHISDVSRVFGQTGVAQSATI